MFSSASLEAATCSGSGVVNAKTVRPSSTRNTLDVQAVVALGTRVKNILSRLVR